MHEDHKLYETQDALAKKSTPTNDAACRTVRELYDVDAQLWEKYCGWGGRGAMGSDTSQHIMHTTIGTTNSRSNALTTVLRNVSDEEKPSFRHGFDAGFEAGYAAASVPYTSGVE